MADPTLYLFDGFNLLHSGGFESPDALRDLLAGWVATKGRGGSWSSTATAWTRPTGPSRCGGRRTRTR